MVGYIFDATKGETPGSLAQKRAIAKALLGAQRVPQNVGEGISALGDGIVARVLNERADSAEQSGMASAQDAFGPILAALGGGGGFPAAPSSPSLSAAPATPREPAISTMDPLQTEAATGEIPSDMQKYRDGIASIESGGRYDIIGPTHPKLGRALGKYQVMEANVGPWSEKHLGRKISADEFLANPKLQDAIFDGEFGGYLKKFGPEGAAQAWFGGEGGVGKVGRKDVLGTSIGGYGKRFVNAIGGASEPAPVQVASLDPASGMGSVDPYSRIPATDTRGEDQRAKFREWNSNPIANEAQNLAGVDPAMRKVIERAKQIAGTDFVLGSGQRDPAMQKKAMEWGWSKTEDSDHLGGGAADLWPVDANGAVNFDPQAQAKIVTAMKQAAQELGVDMEAGADWKSFKDMPHFGMVGQTPMNGPIPPMRDGSQPQVASADPVVPMPTPGEPAPGKRIAQALTGSQTDAMPEMAGNAPMGQGGLSIPQLLAAGSNPFMPEGNQKIIDLLMQEEMKKRDPAYNLDLEKTRTELDLLKNPRMSPSERANYDLNVEKFGAENAQRMWEREYKGREFGLKEREFSSVDADRTADNTRDDSELAIKQLEYMLKTQPDFYAKYTAQEEAAGRQPLGILDYAKQLKQAGAGNTTVNMGEGDKFYENLDKKNAETFAALSESGVAAASKLVQLDRLEGLLATAPQGAVGMLKLAAGEYGINTEGLSDIQATQALINELVPQQRQPGSGPMSDADLALFKQSVPRVLNQPGGNQLIVDTMRGIAQYQVDMGRIADAVADREISPAEGRKAIRALANPLANFKAPNGDGQAAATGSAKQPMVIDGYKIEEVP